MESKLDDVEFSENTTGPFADLVEVDSEKRRNFFLNQQPSIVLCSSADQKVTSALGMIFKCQIR